jgi:hypothetical protein
VRGAEVGFTDGVNQSILVALDDLRIIANASDAARRAPEL